jgi:hypothetical protein
MMSNVIITKDMSMEERAEILRERVRAFNRYNDVTLPAVKIPKNVDVNYNHWTDAPQYAEKYYGERMRDTIAMDNDWD